MHVPICVTKCDGHPKPDAFLQGLDNWVQFMLAPQGQYNCYLQYQP